MNIWKSITYQRQSISKNKVSEDELTLCGNTKSSPVTTLSPLSYRASERHFLFQLTGSPGFASQVSDVQFSNTANPQSLSAFTGLRSGVPSSSNIYLLLNKN